MKSPRYECSTTPTERKPVCACGCGEPFGPNHSGRNRFKRGHYRFIPDRHVVDPETGCWIWQGPVAKSGFGVARNDRRKIEHVHRLYYEALVRPLADDEIARHDPAKCRNRLCCNPDHQEIVSKSEYQSRRVAEQWERQRANPGEHHIGPKRDTVARELAGLAAIPVPEDAKERGLATIQRELRASGASLHPQPVEGQIAGLDALPPEASLSLLSSSDRGADRVIGPVVGGSGRTRGEHS